MGKKLTGMLNLSKIPKSLITANKNLDKVLWIDIVPNKDGEDKYGNTHSIQVWDKEAKKAVYLGNLKPQDFGGKAETAPKESGNSDETEDLPF